MLKKSNKVLTLILAVMMMGTISLTGCKSKSDTKVDSPVVKTTEPPKKPVTINYMTFRTDDDAIMTTLINKFQSENPDVKVNRTSTKDTGAYYQTLKANIVSNADVDVFDIHPSVDFANYAKDGTLADLSSLDFNNTYTDSAKAITSINGKNYGYLNGVNMILCFYNKTLFSEAGVKVPTNFTELASTVNVLKAKNLGGVSYCGGDVAGVWLGNAVINETLGSEGFLKLQNDIDTGAVTNLKDNAGYYSTLKTLAEINKNKLLYDNASTIKYDQALSLFASKKAAIMMMGTWTVGTSEKDFPGIDYGIFPMPTLDKGDVAYAEPAHITVALAKSKNVQAATKFINWLGKPENAKAYSGTAKVTPTVKGVKADFKGSDMLSAVMDKGVSILPVLNLKNSDSWSAAFNQVFANVLFKNADPDKEIAALEVVLKKADLKNKK